jgi:hypothetical protein
VIPITLDAIKAKESGEPSIANQSIHKLYINYPNPFNASTTTSYKINTNSYVTITTYDLKERIIEQLVSAQHTPQQYNLTRMLLNMLRESTLLL